MVLVKSDDGFYNPYRFEETPFSDFIKSSATATQRIGPNERATPSGEWLRYSESFSDRKIRNESNSSNSLHFLGYAEEGETKEYTPLGGRLATKWDQRGHYNQAVPYFEDGTDQHSFVGCGAVAVGQYLFHSHKYFSTPAYAVTNATYNKTSNTYSFSGLSTTVWNSMDDGSDPFFKLYESKMWPTSVFLGYVAKELNSVFGKNMNEGTGTTNESYVNFLRDKYGMLFQISPYSSIDVCNILQSGNPVIAASVGTQIIDNNIKSVFSFNTHYLI